MQTRLVKSPNMDEEVWCFVELSVASNTLNFVITVQRSEDFKRLSVEVEDDCLILAKDQIELRYQLHDIELLPLTCRGLKHLQNGELIFNIQGKKLCQYEDDKSKVYRSQKLSSQAQLVADTELYQNKWFCSVCQQRIIKESSFFTRVLPLPSENWSDFADIWFCHRHEDAQGNHGNTGCHQNGKLLPKQRDCLVGDTYILISSRQADREAIKVDQSGMITCRRCGRQIGITVGTKQDPGSSESHEVYKLYLCSLQLIKDIHNYNSRYLPFSGRSRSERFFSTLLSEQSQIYTSFRFIIESPVKTVVNQKVTNTTSYCLIWLLDSGVTVYTNRSSRQTGNQIDDHCNTDGSGSGANGSNLVKENIMKLLFRCQLSAADTTRPIDFTTKAVVSLWQKDNTVHSISLPHPVFLQMIDQLICNTKCLPQSQRLLNGFHVSFLRQSDSGFGT